MLDACHEFYFSYIWGTVDNTPLTFRTQKKNKKTTLVRNAYCLIEAATEGKWVKGKEKCGCLINKDTMAEPWK